MLSAEAVHGIEHLLEFCPDGLETLDGARMGRDTGMVVFDLLLRRIDFKTFFLGEVDDHADFFYIGCRVETCAVFIALGFDECEFLFPKAQSAQRYTYDF